MQRYDLLAFALILFATIVLVAIALDPKGFSLQSWQTLLAAIVTLGGASLVYRGALLAYRAALSRIELDRGIHIEEIVRKERAVLLRLRFCAHLVSRDARVMDYLTNPTLVGLEPQLITPSLLTFRNTEALDEAWQNLEIFPADLADDLSNLKLAMVNFPLAVEGFGGSTIDPDHPPPQEMKHLKEVLSYIQKLSLSIAKAAEEQVKLRG